MALFACWACVSAWSQGTDTSLTLSLRGVTLKELFTAIENQSDYTFVYDAADVDTRRKINAVYSGQSLDKVLSETLKGLKYEIRGNQVIIRKFSEEKKAPTRRITVSGKVKDAAGEPIIGANVIENGASTGTITDADGHFSLAVASDATIKVSFIGYATREMKVKGQTTLNITLDEDSKMLDEVVIVSYGSQLKREVTGSVSQLNTKGLSDMPVLQFSQEMQGKIAGVQVNQYSGRVGSGMAFRIRGAASLSSGNSPLIVVDGIPLTGDANNINPSEIESLSVLKDASASALYGSRAANGVILITTRKAKAGDARLEFAANYGVQTVPQRGRPDMMNAREWAEFQNEYYEDRVKYEGYTGELDPLYENPERYGEGTDWFDVMTRSAAIQKYDLSLFKGGDNYSTSAMIGYSMQDGVVENTGVKMISARLNQMFKLKDFAEIGINVAPSYKLDHNSLMAFDGVNNIFNKALQASPLVAPVDEDGNMPLYVNTSPMLNNINPYKIIMETVDDYTTARLLANGYLSITPLKGLTLKTSLATDMTWERRKYFRPGNITADNVATGTSSYYNDYTWISETNLTYANTFKDAHKLEVLLGFSAQKYSRESNSLSGSNFSSDDIPYLSNATSITSGTSNITEYALLSLLGRINYNYRGKYLISAAIRRDGSSRFGASKRYGYFPSISGGWVVSEEKFMQAVPHLDMLKLRASYGITGNDNIGNYTHIANIGEYNYVFNGTLVSGASGSNIANTDLAWERTAQFDFGVDITMFNNRFSLSYDYYKKATDNMIQDRPIPEASGFASITSNVGKIHFWGHEISLGYNNRFGKFSWQSNFNISFDRNKIIELVEPGYITRNTSEYSDYYRNQEGYPLSQFFGYIKLGLYKDEEDLANSPKSSTSQVGTIKFKDVNEDGVINVQDRTFIGDPNPDFLFGFTNNFEYAGFDLGITMTGSYGGKIISSLTHQYLGNLDGAFNLLAAAKDRWRSPENPGSGVYPRTMTGTTAEHRKVNTSWIESNSHLSVKNITLGYQVPLPKNKYCSNLRVYASIQNVFFISQYSGANPEVSLNGLNGTGIGVDENSYPIPRIYSLGLNVTF